VFPETKGRSLEEIAEIFDGPHAVVDTRASEKELNKNLYEEQIEERIERA
jgi:hypothetical protein